MTVTVAAIQMYAAPFEVSANLARACTLIEAAVAQGARLVLLPELFNTGYSYNQSLYDYAEPLDGVTATWLRAGAQKLGCYLAGGILERSGGDAYSTLLLAGPDGSLAAYRKRHLFFWERSLFRPGTEPLLVESALGRIGMLMGADIAYDDSATAYAGQADLLLLSSTAALLPDSTVRYPNGRTLSMARFNPAFAGRAAQMRYDYYGGVGNRAAAQQLPIIHAVQCGIFHSPLPAERMGLLHTLFRQPRQLGLRLRRGQARVSAIFLGHSAVFDGAGHALAVQPEDEGVVLAQLDLPADTAFMAHPPGVVEYGAVRPSL
jgi:predicted amidohydrolase